MSREAFEEWCTERWGGDRGGDSFLRHTEGACSGEYVSGPVQFAWSAWSARDAEVAALEDKLASLAAVHDVTNQMFADAQAEVAALKAQVAESRAECERLKQEADGWKAECQVHYHEGRRLKQEVDRLQEQLDAVLREEQKR